MYYILCLLLAAPPPSAAPQHDYTVEPRARANPRPQSPDSPMLNYIFDSYAASNKHFHDKLKPPSFESGSGVDGGAIEEAATGSTVLLDCKVTSLRDKKVAWLKVSEDEALQLLTLDLDTHTADARYRVELSGDNWRLGLSDAKVHDSGLYCCQVSTHPPLLRRVQLIVHPPELRLVKEVFLETGETLSLKCAVAHLHAGDSAAAMRWYRGDMTTQVDELRGGLYIDTDRVRLVSELQIAELKMEDAGNYTCALLAPIVMNATTRVHVLQGSSLAELQSHVQTPALCNNFIFISLLIIIVHFYDAYLR